MRRSDEGLGRSRSDAGVRNLWRVLGSVVLLLGAWYGLLIRQAPSGRRPASSGRSRSRCGSPSNSRPEPDPDRRRRPARRNSL